MDEKPKLKFQPQDPLSVWMRQRHAENGKKLREAAPRLRAWLQSLNGETYDA